MEGGKTTDTYNPTRHTWPCCSGTLEKELLFVQSNTSLIWTSHVLQGTRTTQPCLTGHHVHCLIYRLLITVCSVNVLH